MEEIKKDFKKIDLLPFHYNAYVAILLGQITCGYALGITGKSLSIAQNTIGLSDVWVGLIGAGSLIGLIGSSWMGKLADRFGRRAMLLTNMYIFSILSLLQLVTQNPWWLFIIRIILGLMMAIDYTVGNSWMVEWLPSKFSSRAQSSLIIFWTIGFALSYLVGSCISLISQNTWQLILATSAVPGIITAGYRQLTGLPSSPIWIATHVDNHEAEEIVEDTLGNKYGISKQLKAAQAPEKISWKTLFTKKYRRRTLVGGLFYACQTFAFFGISIFLPILLQNMGIKSSDFSGVIYNICMIIGVLIGAFLFKRISRRLFLTGHLFLSAILLILLVVNNALSPVVQITIFALFSIVLSAGMTLDYPYPTELFNYKVRATGVGTCITISRFGAAGGTFLLPILTTLYSASCSMLVCTIILIIGGLVCLFWAPETSPKYIHKE